MIIDFHTHIFHPEIKRNRDECLQDPAFALLYADSKSRIADSDDLLLYMDESSIDIAVAMAFPWHDTKRSAMHNEYMAAINEKHRGRVYCFGTVAVTSGREEVKRQVHETKNSGLAGIGELGFYADGFTRDNARFLRNVLEAAGEESLPVCLHVNEPVGHMYNGKYRSGLHDLYMILSEFRDVKVVLAHWGGGMFMYELMPEVKESLVNVWYDTAATPFLYSGGIYDAAIASAGAEKIIFGSDFPLLGLQRYSGILEVLDSAHRERIMYRNAAAVLGL